MTCSWTDRGIAEAGISFRRGRKRPVHFTVGDAIDIGPDVYGGDYRVVGRSIDQPGSRMMSHGVPATAAAANGGRITSTRAAARFPSSDES